MTETDQLWGGTLTEMRFDATRRVLDLIIDLEYGRDHQSWLVRLEDVSNLRVDRPDTGWDYTEVTEVHASDGNGRRQIELVFWAEPNGLSASCSKLAIERRV